jgi:hypothetical protein
LCKTASSNTNELGPDSLVNINLPSFSVPLRRVEVTVCD